MRVLNASQMREADRRTIDDIGIPSIVLMENAGRQVVAAVNSLLGESHDRQVCVLAGRGNNGGDGFVVARVLSQHSSGVIVCLIGARGDVRGDARTNLDILDRLGIAIAEVEDDEAWARMAPDVMACDVIVDAIFGTGLSAPARGVVKTIADDLNASDIPVIAVDLPSGLSSDSALLIGPSIVASVTVTFGAPKLPLVLPPAEATAGSLVVADIGIPASVIGGVDGPRIEFVLEREARALLPERDVDTHKGSYGHVCLMAGSPGKTGAAYLGGMAALRSGAGLVTVATPASVRSVVASLGAEYMTLALPEDADGRVTQAAAAAVLEGAFSVLAAGPGIGTTSEQQALIRALVQDSTAPLVLDADALAAFADGRASGFRARGDQIIVMTPHPGEMARLAGCATADVQARRIACAGDFATAHNVIVVLKGYRTIVAAPDGRVFINSTGNPGMATGGSGDVLTGAIAAWLGQSLDPVDACVLAVFLHGLAGDLAARRLGEAGLTAGDILKHLCAAERHLATGERVAGDSESESQPA